MGCPSGHPPFYYENIMMNYFEVKKEFEKSPLPSLGVIFPTMGTQKADTLVYLYNHLGLVVKKKDVSGFA